MRAEILTFTRRATLAGFAAGVATPAWPQLRQYKAQLQLGQGAEYGFATFDMATGSGPSANGDLRFPMCSTFKWLLAARVLSRVDAGEERLDRPVSFGSGDILDYAPTSKSVLAAGGGAGARMTVDALCEAAVELSDNTAANLLLAGVGGPPGLTAWLRAHGDAVTTLERTEPALNHVAAGETRDTTTPAAIVGNLRRILFGDVLAPASRRRLMEWMLACKTGETRLKAGLPPEWRIAQKTGTWNYNPDSKEPQRAASGDVGVLFPPRGAPILIAAYTAGSTRPQAEVDRWFAAVARQVSTPLP